MKVFLEWTEFPSESLDTQAAVTAAFLLKSHSFICYVPLVYLDQSGAICGISACSITLPALFIASDSNWFSVMLLPTTTSQIDIIFILRLLLTVSCETLLSTSSFSSVFKNYFKKDNVFLYLSIQYPFLLAYLFLCYPFYSFCLFIYYKAKVSCSFPSSCLLVSPCWTTGAALIWCGVVLDTSHREYERNTLCSPPLSKLCRVSPIQEVT